MADTPLDDLRIEIDASADNAKASIDKLIGNLEALQEATGNIQTERLTALCHAIRGLSENMKELPKASDFTRLAKGIEKINSINTDGISTVTSAINDLAESVSALNASGISDVRFNVSRDGVTAANETAQAEQQLVQVNEEVRQSMENTADAAAVESNAEENLSGSTQTLIQRLRNLLSGTESLRERLSSLGSSAGGAARGGFSGLSQVAHGITSIFRRVGTIASSIGKRFSSLSSKMKRLSGNTSLAAKFMDKFRNSMSRVSDAAGPLTKKLGKVNRLLVFMVLRKGITVLLDSLGTAFEHLAQKSDDFNQKISELISSASYFSHQVAAMAKPLIDIFGPALTYIINLLAKALSYINQFLSALTGKKFFTQAKKVAVDYADSLGGVTKKIKEIRDAVVGIDELNIISPNDDDNGGGGGGGAADLEDCYEELAINQKILDLVEKLKNLLSELFEPMKQAWDDYGQSVIDAFHYALESVWQLMKDMATTWKEVWLNGSGYELCKNILLLLREILLWIGDIAVAWDNAWKNKGYAYVQSIFDMLNSILSLIITISQSFRAAWNSGSGQEVIEHIYQILTNCHNVVTNLATRFEEAWRAAGTGNAIAQALFDILNSILATIERITGSVVEWAANLNFSPLLTAIKDLLEAIKPIVDDIGKAFEWLFTDIIEPGLKWAIEQGLPTALEALAAALEGIHNAVSEMDPETLQAIGKALIAIAGCVKAVEVITKITSAFASLKAVLAGSKIVGIISGIVEAFQLAIGGAGTLGEAFAAVFGPIGAAISSVVSIVGGAVLAIMNFVSMLQDGFSWIKEILMIAGIAIAAVGAVIAGVDAAPAAIVAAVVAALATLVVVVKEHWQQICDFFTVTIPEWWTGTVIPFFQGIPEWFAGIWGKVKDFAVEKWDALLNYLQGIPQKISDFVTKVGNWFSQLPGKIGYALGYALGKIVQWGVDVWNYLSTKVPEIVNNVKTWFMELPGKIYSAISGTVSKIVKWASDVAAKFKEKVSEIVSKVKEWFSELPQKIYDAVIKVKEKITKWVSDVKAFCAEKIPQIIDSIVEFFKTLPEKLKELGKDIIQGLIDGIKNAWESLKTGVADFCSNFVQGFKDALGIHSPSTVFAEIGGFSADGLVQGIQDKFSTVQQTVGEWASNVIKWFTEDGGVNATKFSSFASNIISGFREKVGNTYTTVKDNITTWAGKVRSWFTEEGGVNSTKFTTFATNIIDGFKTRIGNYYSTAKDNISTWASKVRSWFTEDGGVNSKKFTSFATNIIDGFKSRIGNYYTTARDNIITWGSKCVSWFEEKSGKSSWETVATNVVDGFKNKIGSIYTTCKDTIQSWGSSIIDWFKEKLDINSPSKVFEQLAGFTVEGFANGISGADEATVKTPMTMFAENIISWFTNAGGINKTSWETFAGDIISGFSTKISNAYTTVKDSITTWATAVRTWYTDSGNGSVNAVTFSTYAGNVIDAFKNKVGNYYSTVRDNVITWANSVRTWYTTDGGVNNVTWTTYAGNIVDGFKTKIGNYYSTVSTNVLAWANKVKTWFSGSGSGAVNSSTWSTYAQNVVDGFKSKIGSYYSTSSANITAWASATKTWFTNISGSSAWYSIASDVVNGFKNGIGALYSTCKNTIQSWGSDIISWFKEKLGIHSPSRVFSQLAEFTVQGFNRGVENEGKSTTDYINSWLGKLKDIQVDLSARFNVSEELSKYKANLDGGITQNTILRTVQESINTSGAVQATLESGGGIKEAFMEAISEGMGGFLENIEKNTKIQAEKREQTIVNVGNREVARSVDEQKKADGYSFIKGSSLAPA